MNVGCCGNNHNPISSGLGTNLDTYNRQGTHMHTKAGPSRALSPHVLVGNCSTKAHGGGESSQNTSCARRICPGSEYLDPTAAVLKCHWSPQSPGRSWFSPLPPAAPGAASIPAFKHFKGHLDWESRLQQSMPPAQSSVSSCHSLLPSPIPSPHPHQPGLGGRSWGWGI